MNNIIYARTNFEFLNKAFGTDYKGWPKCTWKYDEKTVVWMIEITGNVSKYGWKNFILDDGNTVCEEYVLPGDKIIPTHDKLHHFRRIIVKREKAYDRYIIMGLYEYDFKHSIEESKRVWRKVSDEII
ncbi:MAG: hypothetical protein J6B09_00610 [Clostridia bacterium]|jgi:uncharacterized protein (UPF0248 family)|nr:hypothetical protein [Clostridia bacterium]